MESFRKKLSTKPRKSQAWGLGSNTLPSILSADLSKVYRKFLSPLAISTERGNDRLITVHAPFLALAITPNLNGPQQLT